MSAPVTIQDYDPLWPSQFETIRSRIAGVLDEIATAIEHIGSTAVSGLAAKAIIDIDVVLRSAADLPLAVTRLASLGYQHQGDLGVKDREVFRAPADSLPHHLYVCPPDGVEHRRHIAFRDYLRSHPADADAYSRLKRKLAAECGADRDAYTRGKGTFVEEILSRALVSGPQVGHHSP